MFFQILHIISYSETIRMLDQTIANVRDKSRRKKPVKKKTSLALLSKKKTKRKAIEDRKEGFPPSAANPDLGRQPAARHSC